MHIRIKTDGIGTRFLKALLLVLLAAAVITLVTPAVSNAKDVVLQADKTSGQDITIGRQKKGGKSLEKSATTEKEGSKTSSSVGKEETASGIDLRGCWEDHAGRRITIRQEGGRVAAIHPYYGRTFTGSINGDTLKLRYVFKNTQDIAAVWKKARGAVPPLKVLKQVPRQLRYLGFDFKIVSKGKLAGNFRTLYVSYDRGSEEFDYAETQSDPLEWKRQEAKLKSIFVTDKTFQHPLTEVKSGDRFWIKAKASSGCEGVIDRAVVTIYPEGEDESEEGIKVTLVETGPDTLEFRSPAEGIQVVNKEEEKKEVQDKGKDKAGKPLKAKEEAGAGKSKKTEKSGAKGGEKAVSGHKEKQEIIEVGAQPGIKKKAGFKTTLNRNKTKLINEKKWLEKELKNRKKTLNNLGHAKALYIRHYRNSEGKKLARLEIMDKPELSEQGFKLDKTESVLFMRKAKEHLNKEIGKIQTDLKRIMKVLGDVHK